MKKTTLALAVALATLTTAANAALPENTYYVGGKLGWSQFYDTDSAKVPNTSKVSDSRVGFGGFVGYQATPYLAAELGYDWLGNLTYKDSGSNTNGRLRVHGASVTGKASYPLGFISDDLDIYGRVGAFIHTTKYTGHGNDTSVSPTYALGLDYRMNEDFSTRLEYQWVNNIGNEGPTRPDNALLSFGVVYRLGSPAVKQPTEFEYRENRYVLSEDILFPYGKSELKTDGQQALDALISSLVKLNPAQSAIVVIGHTDRIGSVSYNQKLSEERAKSVVKYLLAKGVPADLITAHGAGKSQPVTGNTCNALKKAELKACLAPDRRVEIEIKAKTVEQVEVTNSK
ncbi:porin OmpA [Orbaceae bacterium ac157xtp]